MTDRFVTIHDLDGVQIRIMPDRMAVVTKNAVVSIPWSRIESAHGIAKSVWEDDPCEFLDPEAYP